MTHADNLRYASNIMEEYMYSAAIRTRRKSAILPFPTGRIPTVDPRNEKFRLYGSAAMPPMTAQDPELPRTITLQMRPDEFNQGNYPSCCGWTGYEHLLCYPALIGRSKLTAIGIYQAAQIYDEIPGEGYEGTTILGVLKFLHKHQTARDIKEYRWARTVPEMNMHIAKKIHSGVLVGTNWYDSMFYPDKEGIVRIKPGGVVTGHAYYRIGYDLRRGLGKYQNHWGKGWGLNGRFWIPMEDEQRLLNEDGEAGVTIKYQKNE